jgi:DNA-binding NarL/FixJ family response regulator
MKSIRVLLAEDHALVRAGMCALLESLENIEVVAQASDGHEACALIEEHLPDIAVLDISMPGMNGLEATARILRTHPEVRVMILSMFSSEEYVLQALRLGASGYLIKDSGLSELELAIRAVAAGETYLSPAVSKHVTDYVRRVGGPDPLESLTPRQREILQLIAEGKNTQQMADKLFISTKTVESHRVLLMEKLNIHDVAGLIRFAIRAGIVPPE